MPRGAVHRTNRLRRRMRVSAARSGLTEHAIEVLPAREPMELTRETTHHGFPPVDGDGVVHGIVTGGRPARIHGGGSAGVTFFGETLTEALPKPGVVHVGRGPVVSAKITAGSRVSSRTGTSSPRATTG